VKAVERERYGSADRLRIVEVERPADATVRVHASSLNRADVYLLQGLPLAGRAMMGLRRPKTRRVGIDFAGVDEATGRRVYGTASGALAEYVAAEETVAPMPTTVGFEEAATLPVAGITALQGLRKGGVTTGTRVLVNGASGSVGPFAVQIAKALGAEVTAVCSTANVEQTRALGADRVVDYTREDFTRSGERYDVIFDNAGSRTWRELKRVLAPNATIVLVGGPKGLFLGPLWHVARITFRARLSGVKTTFFMAHANGTDLAELAQLVDDGKVRPVIERRYELGQIADAYRYVATGHTRGKVVVTL
jgi:NADPH:quinone reductase-like Zn-dependent oxidoreductase